MVRYLFVFIISVCIASTSQLLLKKSAGIERKTKIKEYLNIYVIFSYLLLFASTLLTLYAYQGIKLSMGLVLETIGYILVPILSYFFLKEEINKKTMLGIGIIILGIIIYSL